MNNVRHITCVYGPKGNGYNTFRTAFFRDITWRRSVVSFRRFGTRRSAGPLKMGPIGCPETAVRKCRSRMCKIAKERISHWHRGGILKSSTVPAPSSYMVNKTLKLTAMHWTKRCKSKLRQIQIAAIAVLHVVKRKGLRTEWCVMSYNCIYSVHAWTITTENEHYVQKFLSKCGDKNRLS
jgi:hypothetical protein